MVDVRGGSRDEDRAHVLALFITAVATASRTGAPRARLSRMSRLSSCIVALALFLAAPAHAQTDVEARLAAVREQIMQARFGDAVSAARAVLDADDLSAAERNAALELLAVAQLANRQSNDAAQTLQLLYSRDPGHRLSDPDASPPVLSAFARARESHPEQVPVVLDHSTPTMARREAPELTVRVTQGDDAVAELRLVYRMGSEAPSRVVMTRRSDGSYVARIPVVGDASTATDVAYHIVALAPSLAPLAQAGTAAEPLQLRIPAETRATAATVTDPAPALAPAPATPPSGGSVAEEWWFWTLIAVVVVGGAVTAGILLGPAQEGPEQGTLGSVRLMSIELP